MLQLCVLSHHKNFKLFDSLFETRSETSAKIKHIYLVNPILKDELCLRK